MVTTMKGRAIALAAVSVALGFAIAVVRRPRGRPEPAGRWEPAEDQRVTP